LQRVGSDGMGLYLFDRELLKGYAHHAWVGLAQVRWLVSSINLAALHLSNTTRLPQ
jgi:hypothetical protein